jgi:ribonucleoside-diphosphate reductase alpha chain
MSGEFLQVTAAARAATRIQQATVAAPVPDADAIACSLENPESCEACQ